MYHTLSWLPLKDTERIACEPSLFSGELLSFAETELPKATLCLHVSFMKPFLELFYTCICTTKY